MFPPRFTETSWHHRGLDMGLRSNRRPMLGACRLTAPARATSGFVDA
jgi:hypothetical protein